MLKWFLWCFYRIVFYILLLHFLRTYFVNQEFDFSRRLFEYNASGIEYGLNSFLLISNNGFLVLLLFPIESCPSINGSDRFCHTLMGRIELDFDHGRTIASEEGDWDIGRILLLLNLQQSIINLKNKVII